jgi:hypothetical protein
MPLFGYSHTNTELIEHLLRSHHDTTFRSQNFLAKVRIAPRKSFQ